TVFWAFPFLQAGGLWFAWQWRAPVKIAGRFFVCGTICLAILLPHGLRNLGLYGSPVGARSTQGSAMNSPLSISGGLSNLIRNMALHANTGIPPLTHGLSRFLAAAHELTGRSLQDPGTTLYADSFQFPLEFKINDSETGNPYHLALILFAAGLLALRPGQHPRLVICAGLLLAGMATFCF